MKQKIATTTTMIMTTMMYMIVHNASELLHRLPKSYIYVHVLPTMASRSTFGYLIYMYLPPKS